MNLLQGHVQVLSEVYGLGTWHHIGIRSLYVLLGVGVRLQTGDVGLLDNGLLRNSGTRAGVRCQPTSANGGLPHAGHLVLEVRVVR